MSTPRHEELVGKALQDTGIPVSLSSRVLPEFREYERTSATVINAYLIPVVNRYLEALNLEPSAGAGSSHRHAVQWWDGAPFLDPGRSRANSFLGAGREVS